MSESVDQRESMLSLRPEAQPPQPLPAYLDLRKSDSHATILSAPNKDRDCISFLEFPAILQIELEQRTKMQK